jgi:hypothetical protein
LRDVDEALAASRAQRVAAAFDPRSELWDIVGLPPGNRGGRAAWCGIAEQVQSWLDRGLGSGDGTAKAVGGRTHPRLGLRPASDAGYEWDRLALLLNQAPDIIAAARRLDRTPGQPLWERELGRRSVEATHTVAIEPPAPTVHRGLGRGL